MHNPTSVTTADNGYFKCKHCLDKWPFKGKATLIRGFVKCGGRVITCKRCRDSKAIEIVQEIR